MPVWALYKNCPEELQDRKGFSQVAKDIYSLYYLNMKGCSLNNSPINHNPSKLKSSILILLQPQRTLSRFEISQFQQRQDLIIQI